MKILVLGGYGQLGLCFQSSCEKYNNIGFNLNQYIFWGREDFDLASDIRTMREKIMSISPDVIINCAAYTSVDKAEGDEKTAHLINEVAPKNLMKICDELNIRLILFSSDYVISSNINVPYPNNVALNEPTNVYGRTKSNMERFCSLSKNVLIFRISWLYSEFTDNFMTKIINKLNVGLPFQVVADQVGCPTYAMDLSDFIVKLLMRADWNTFSGIYNFSNTGVASWYDFAKHIEIIYSPMRFGKNTELVVPCNSVKFQSLTANRPSYSVLDLTATMVDFQCIIPYWVDSLKKCIFEYYRKY